jgi:hypothetical protein
VTQAFRKGDVPLRVTAFVQGRDDAGRASILPAGFFTVHLTI